MNLNGTAETLVRNVRTAMCVAGAPNLGRPSAITQQELMDTSGISRSTLTGQMRGGDKEVNPKLEQITRVAEALGVPPAFLLMRPDDWTRLAQVVIFYGQLMRSSSSRVDALISKFSSTHTADVEEQVLIADQLARALGVENHVSKESIAEAGSHLQAEMNAANSEAKRRIFTSASLPDLSKMTGSERFAALLLSTVFAAHYRPAPKRADTKPDAKDHDDTH